MSNRINLSFKLFLPLLSIASYIYSDSFDFNTYNNHGIIGLINTPTARFYEEGSHGITYFDGDPDQKITFHQILMIGLKHRFLHEYRISRNVDLIMKEKHIVRATKIKALT